MGGLKTFETKCEVEREITRYRKGHHPGQIRIVKGDYPIQKGNHPKQYEVYWEITQYEKGNLGQNSLRFRSALKAYHP